MYALGQNAIATITETSPIHPSSKKGAVRAQVDQMLLDAMQSGKVDVLIARAPDFFGPVKKQNSLIMNFIYDNFKKGKRAQWIGNADVKHTMGYTPDLAKATAILGNTASAYQQIWNLPVDMNSLTGREWANLFAREMNATNKIQVLPKWLMNILGLFIPILGELSEMNYQFEHDYHFDCTKFKQAFDFKITTNEEAVRETVKALGNS